MSSPPTPTRGELSKYFHLPIAEAALHLGSCVTVVKKLCRSFGIPRWPHRKVSAIHRKIEQLELEHKKATTEVRREDLTAQLRATQAQLEAILSYSPPPSPSSSRSSITVSAPRPTEYSSQGSSASSLSTPEGLDEDDIKVFELGNDMDLEIPLETSFPFEELTVEVWRFCVAQMAPLTASILAVVSKRYRDELSPQRRSTQVLLELAAESGAVNLLEELKTWPLPLFKPRHLPILTAALRSPDPLKVIQSYQNHFLPEGISPQMLSSLSESAGRFGRPDALAALRPLAHPRHSSSLDHQFLIGLLKGGHSGLFKTTAHQLRLSLNSPELGIPLFSAALSSLSPEAVRAVGQLVMRRPIELVPNLPFFEETSLSIPILDWLLSEGYPLTSAFLHSAISQGNAELVRHLLNLQCPLLHVCSSSLLLFETFSEKHVAALSLLISIRPLSRSLVAHLITSAIHSPQPDFLDFLFNRGLIDVDHALRVLQTAYERVPHPHPARIAPASHLPLSPAVLRRLLDLNIPVSHQYLRDSALFHADPDALHHSTLLGVSLDPYRLSQLLPFYSLTTPALRFVATLPGYPLSPDALAQLSCSHKSKALRWALFHGYFPPPSVLEHLPPPSADSGPGGEEAFFATLELLLYFAAPIGINCSDMGHLPRLANRFARQNLLFDQDRFELLFSSMGFSIPFARQM